VGDLIEIWIFEETSVTEYHQKKKTRMSNELVQPIGHKAGLWLTFVIYNIASGIKQFSNGILTCKLVKIVGESRK